MSDIIERMLAGSTQERTAEVVDLNSAEGTIEALLVPYEVEAPISADGTVTEIVTRGAFARCDPRRVAMFDQQHAGPVIGRALELEDRPNGVFGRFKISDTALGRDVLTLIRDEALREMSIEFLPQKRYMRVDQSGDGSTRVRHDRATLLGVSPVSRGAYGEHARVLQVRSEYLAAAQELAERKAAETRKAQIEEIRARELAEIASYTAGQP